ncbi:pyrroloquinoline quinone biosynthesis peptide chaperone PqqD [Streptomyces alboflavus]|uniref:pyrroloquinoline quinone biosynthesis peptide chaperone PqqD n=1 Tax=Streptomyces alboflavus TaxID=67267 RepID=UPI0009979330|nr:pyrroloquinoline quinone biosynthesis peptide chaperone PqqD [Streptomyces alboflavus]
MREVSVDGDAWVADGLGEGDGPGVDGWGADGPGAGSSGAGGSGAGGSGNHGSDAGSSGAGGPTVAHGPGGVATEPVPPDWRPVLARSVVLRRDRVRGADLLLLPERVVVLRGAAASIVALCDGERDVAGIVAELERRHPGAPVGAEVPVFLGRLRAQRWLR